MQCKTFHHEITDISVNSKFGLWDYYIYYDDDVALEMAAFLCLILQENIFKP
jgi:hypothetical protein